MKGFKNVIIVFLAIVAAFEAGLIISYGFVMKAINEVKTNYRRPIHYSDYYMRRESGDE